MATTSSSNSSKSRVRSYSNHGASMSNRINEAIRDKSCPICLRFIGSHCRAAVLTTCLHVYCVDCIRKWSEIKRNCPLCNAKFDSWFVRTRVSSRRFEKERLRELNEGERAGSGDRTRQFDRFPLPRVSGSRRLVGNLYNVNRMSRPLPWRRSFGQPGFVPSSERQLVEEAVAERVLRWRASIYDRRLKAVPVPVRNPQMKITFRNNGFKERVQGRVEPWIRRELQAILADPDPSVIVHLVTSQYILSLEEKLKDTSRQVAEDTFVEPLRRFLHDKTNMFWHELRCFYMSSLEMKIYDSVVEYEERD